VIAYAKEPGSVNLEAIATKAEGFLVLLRIATSNMMVVISHARLACARLNSQVLGSRGSTGISMSSNESNS